MNVFCLPQTPPPTQFKHWRTQSRLLLAASVLMLSACGGGGGGSTVQSTATAVTPVVTPTCIPSATVTCIGSSGGTVTSAPTTTTSFSLLTGTGITASQCYAAGSNVLTSCVSAVAIALNDKQDGMVGRDVTAPDNADGKLGFSYSTVPNPAGGNFAVTECVKDNITGLIWEGKTASGLRAGSVTYTNYDNTAAAQFFNGTTHANPTQAQIDAATNAIGYKNAVNASALCGYTDWRLPTADELQSLVDYSVPYPGPTIDSTWFPNTPGRGYWSMTPVVGVAPLAWIVYF
ncbi:MAG: hypothetical protein FD135_5546 [Comamonadaceae bacterium]|nr:MAG: hypothetical protein FD135_5546 [Comamonadaceae bacterium]